MDRKLQNLCRIAVLSVALGATGLPAGALSLRDGAEPAEFPPDTYTSDVYVDSRGCIYLRSGFRGAVTWVPQVTRNREVICGAKPSLHARTPVAPPAPKAAAPAARPEPKPPVAGSKVAVPVVPKGFRHAWSDDRLNPNRGARRQIGTSVAAAPAAPSQAPAAADGHYVQVASFGVPQNANRTIALVQRLGLPAASLKQNMNGKVLKVVLAGPFSTSQALQSALAKVRAAGFHDAFARR